MPKFINEVSQFRHRGFQPNDGTAIVMVFGSDPEPLNADGSAMTKLWDHEVNNTVVVTDHVDTP